jgi:transmembrane sensor
MNDEHDRSKGDDIHDVATEWWVKRDAGAMPRSDRRAFEKWLAEKPEHRQAFEEIELLCSQVRAMRPEKVNVEAFASRQRRIASVASVALVTLLALMLSWNELSLLLRADFRTVAGETRTVTLDDGSRVHLGGKSAIAVNYRGAERKVTLIEGEGWFEAEPNAARPFVVAAASGSVTALGTTFDIALIGDIARVTVAKHRVTICSQGGAKVVSEGQQSIFGPETSISSPTVVDVNDETAWRRGKLIFRNRPLGEVVATLARYHQGYLLTPSAAVRELRVSGVFDADDPLGALKVIEESLDIKAIRLTNYLVILHG